MKILVNPYGDKGGRLISDFIHGVVLSMKPGESRKVDDDFALKARNIYPFLLIEDLRDEPIKEELNPLFNGEKKPRKKLFSI